MQYREYRRNFIVISSSAFLAVNLTVAGVNALNNLFNDNKHPDVFYLIIARLSFGFVNVTFGAMLMLSLHRYSQANRLIQKQFKKVSE
jgi:hypothetical protein